jgi:hypothetical protein
MHAYNNDVLGLLGWLGYFGCFGWNGVLKNFSLSETLEAHNV